MAPELAGVLFVLGVAILAVVKFVKEEKKRGK